MVTDSERKHLEEIRPCLSECMVLLKKSGSFPIAGPCKLALYGNGARHTEKGGMGSGEVNTRFSVTVEEGLKEAGFTIVSDNWLNAYDSIREKAEKDFIRKVGKDARTHHTQTIIESMGRVMPEPEYNIPMDDQGEVCIYVLARTSGEGGDRTLVQGDYLLTKAEIRDINALNQKYEKFILVLNTCGPVDLSPVMNCRDILVLSLLGTETGNALADVILGKTFPSGRLAEEWRRAEEVSSILDFGEKDDTRYLEGIYVGYRGSERTGIRPLFSFGQGITYTDFSWKVIEAGVEKSIVALKAEVTTDEDEKRCVFMKKAFSSVLDAKKKGVPVTGYFYWSLLDNFEWQSGFGKKFGLIAVDRKTMKRTPKQSLYVLNDLKKML